MIAGKPVNDAKIPAIAITNDNPLVTKNYPYYFRVCYVSIPTREICLPSMCCEDRSRKRQPVF